MFPPRFTLAVAATVLIIGCSGATPTSPNPAPAPPPASTPAPAPPTPAPPTAPAPPTSVRYTATVDSAVWYGTKWFEDSFVVERFSDHVLVNGREFPEAVGNDTTWTTRLGDEAQFSVYEGGMWTFNGLAGQASGTLR